MLSNTKYNGAAARQQPKTATMLDHALSLAARGLHVFPLKPRGKAPLTWHGKNDATLDDEKIKQWWDAEPNANIGINCAASGIVVVDVDQHEGKTNGYETLAALEAEYGPLQSPVVSKSGSGIGEHRYFRAPDAVRFGKKLAPDGNTKIDRGIDLLHVGYIVAPPSVHPNGGLYEWVQDCSLFDVPELPLLPECVINLGRDDKPDKETHAESASGPMDGSARTVDEIARACSALFWLDAGCARPAWIRLAMAAKDAGVPFEVFDTWSATGANYTTEKDCRVAWSSFKDNKAVRVTAATLFHEAKKMGWTDPAKARSAHDTDADRYRVLSADDLLNAPPLRWLVRGVLPTSGLAALYGPSGSGKSFLALDLCAAIAGGAEEWFERRVTAAPVTYICLEGEAGMGKRVKAWREHSGRALPDRMAFITQSFDLRSAADVDDLCGAVQAAGLGGGLLVIDTLNRAAPGADENASTDMGALIEACKAIQCAIGGAVLAVHHTGKDAAKGLRGHSSLFAALDTAIEVKRDGDRREWSVSKSKDDADGARNPFRLRLVHLSEDGDGEPITSCVVEFDHDREHDVPHIVRREPKGANQILVHAAMDVLLLASEEHGKGGAPAGCACVRKEVALRAVASDLTGEPKRRNHNAARALDSLIAAGLYAEHDGWVWQI